MHGTSEEPRLLSLPKPGFRWSPRKGELVFLHMPGAGLIEPRWLPGQWVGGSSGFSFRIMKGVSCRVGGREGRVATG